MKIPRAIRDLVEQLEKLPGVGPKTAQRLVFYLLHNPQSELDRYAQAFANLKKGTKLCSVCRNVGETDPCDICDDPSRDHSSVCVIEQPLDVLALERSGAFKGVYQVLHGCIQPLNNIGPDQLYIRDLIPRLKSGTIREVIMATNPTMEGEATAMYISKLIDSLGLEHSPKITRLGRGLPVGGDLEYADEVTLTRAMEGRGEF